MCPARRADSVRRVPSGSSRTTSCGSSNHSASVSVDRGVGDVGRGLANGEVEPPVELVEADDAVLAGDQVIDTDPPVGRDLDAVGRAELLRHRHGEVDRSPRPPPAARAGATSGGGAAEPGPGVPRSTRTAAEAEPVGDRRAHGRRRQQREQRPRRPPARPGGAGARRRPPTRVDPRAADPSGVPGRARAAPRPGPSRRSPGRRGRRGGVDRATQRGQVADQVVVRSLSHRASPPSSRSALLGVQQPAELGQGPVQAGLDRAPRPAEDRRGLGLVEVEQVAAGHHLPVLRGESGQPVHQRVTAAPPTAARRPGRRAGRGAAARTAPTPGVPAPPAGPTARCRLRVSLATIRSSQGRNGAPGRKRSRAAYALTNASCTTSSASPPAPSRAAVRIATGA